MLRTKYCCGGNTAELIETHIPVIRKRNGQAVKFFTAIYKCHKCGELTLRGEAQLKSWNSLVEFINEETVQKLKKEKEAYDMAKSGTDKVREQSEA